ncbi:type VI secretion system tip protein VgrG [Myxococcus sp. K38C18041901]|uniref:type VI secretion system Vgr family protein n=1 Tax=Myxococcus guangdongensis TaxID=2906760 RepID=UPI0020A7B8CF|nr:type VI secretion system tip protein TssI/VgrG [Myxococcus guangdongensis]MCP3065264.1 type VI secretion system tip protein VgrG [Myxococcus guangdongensis]
MGDEQRLTATFFFDAQEGALSVHAVRGQEALSRAYRFEVDFSAQDVDVDAAPGARATLVLESPRGGERHVGGVLEEVSLAAMAQAGEGAFGRYRAVLVPEPYLVLSSRRGFRIFQQKSVPDIVKQVCEAAGLEDSAFDWGGVTGAYTQRDFCVQYDESEWDFICRLLEDEGIFFSFSHSADGARMRFEDDSTGVDLLSPDALDFTFFPQEGAPTARVWDFRVRTRLRPSKATVNDYDMLRPGTSLLASAEAQESLSREWYEYPGGFRAPAEGKRRAQVRLDELRTPRVTALGRTDALFVAPGRRFHLQGHPSSDAEYLLTAVGFQLRLEEEPASDRPLVDAGPWRYEVDFEVIPSTQVFRPERRTPRPRVAGVHTARVTGPEGEEIHCDAHGRVKLQFPWDRDGQLDERTSCWVRVSQAHTTGSVMIPRVGWEVLVEFEEGDPDRPLCLGKVWNTTFLPPVELPAGKTVTGHSSISSPGGGGVNEVLFDDTAGAESVTINGQHDILVKAANNKLFSVGHDSSHLVNGKRAASVGGNEQIAIQANLNVNVGGNQSTEVGAMRDVKVTGSTTEEVAGAFDLQVGAMELVQVGNPIKAVMEVIASMVVEKAMGAAAKAASKAEAALLGPILPVLQQAREAVGPAAQFAGPAAALLGGGNPEIAAFAQAAGKLSDAAGAADAGQIAAGVAQSIVADKITSKAIEAVTGEGGGGGGGGGADAAPEAAGSATSGGEGTWATVVGGSVKETVGGLAATSSLSGVSYAVGGASQELVGAARVELIKGSKSETTGAVKMETVGVYMVDAKESFVTDAKAAIAINIAGKQTQRISGSHSMSTDGPVLVTAPRLSLKGQGTITLTCGPSKVIVKSNGILVEGAAEVTIEGSKIELDENALGT